jgi:formate dehydrogenase major subunit
MVTLQINGQQVEAAEGTTVLAAARQAGIFIPTLCDHPALHPSGGCRLCVVEVRGGRGPQTSCTLPVSAGMVVNTDTPALRASRQFVLSMLFSESNHFCPFCTVSGGDCELQNAAYHEGLTHWPYPPAWQPHPVDSSSSSFIFDANRCILCRRCVRACGELVGNFTLGLAERGARTHLVADGGVALGDSSCIACGTCVQICPTGALYGRRDAYQGNTAHTERTASVCVGCSVGCGLQLVTRDRRLVRIDGDWDSSVNAGVLCRRGRFDPLEEARQRLLTPLVRQDGDLAPATWDEALSAAATGLHMGVGQTAALISPRLPVEALSAFRQLLGQGLHNPQVTSLGAAGPLAEAGATDLAALGVADLVIVLNADLERDHPVASFFIKRSLPNGLKLITINAQATALDDLAEQVLRPAPAGEALVLQSWLKALAPVADGAVFAAQAGVPAEAILTLAQTVALAQRPVLVYGPDLTTQHPEALGLLTALAQTVSRLRLLGTAGEANSRAAQQLQLAGPFRPRAGQPVFIDLGDAPVPAELLAAVTDAPFLVVQASYASALTALADVVLPVETWLEQSGHYLNLEGRLQAAHGALPAPAQVRSNVSVLAGLAEQLGIRLDADWQGQLRRPVAAVSLN